MAPPITKMIGPIFLSFLLGCFLWLLPSSSCFFFAPPCPYDSCRGQQHCHQINQFIPCWQSGKLNLKHHANDGPTPSALKPISTAMQGRGTSHYKAPISGMLTAHSHTNPVVSPVGDPVSQPSLCTLSKSKSLDPTLRCP